MTGRRPLPPAPPGLLPRPDRPVRGRPRLVDRFRYLGGNPELWAGGILLGLFVAAAAFALGAYGATILRLPIAIALVTPGPPAGPSSAHPLGVLHVASGGIDELRALVQAAPFDLGIVGGILGGAAGVGLLLGGIAGAREGGGLDLAVTFFTDLIAGVPPFLLATILLVNVEVFLRPDYYLPVFVLLYVLVLWPAYARLVRARAREVAARPFVEAAEAAGAGGFRILRRHVLPNSYTPVLAQMPPDVAGVFFVLTVFPFLACFGAPSGNPIYPLLTPLPNGVFPEWGYLLAQGTCNGWAATGAGAWWMYAFPAATIVLFGLAVTLACDGVEKYLARAHAG